MDATIADESGEPLLEREDIDSEHTISYWPTSLFTFKHRSSHGGSSGGDKLRILDRQGCFHQSRGRWQIRSTGDVQRIIPPRVRRLRDDWFHSLAYTPTPQLFAFLFLWYTLTIVFWAGIYYCVSQFRTVDKAVTQSVHPNKGGSFCGMDITNWMEALYFSLSTMSGIGYGVSDYYFGDCVIPFIIVLAQILNGIAFDAVAIGLLFQRMSRGQKRGRTIIFSHQAVIQRVRGQYYFMFRVGELRSRHIVDARVRVYCIRHERYPNTNHHGMYMDDESSTIPIESFHFVTHHVPLLCNDSSLLMSLPHVFTHKMDWKSPLVPPQPVWYDVRGMKRKTVESNFLIRDHDSYMRQKQDIIDFLQDREVEIVVLLEGTDEVSGTAVQARYSYRWDDVKIDSTFSNCIFPAMDTDGNKLRDISKSSFNQGGLDETVSLGDREIPSADSRTVSSTEAKCIIDFRKFHNIVAAPVDGNWCAYVPHWFYDPVHEKLS
jgi:hypothetical protein